MKNSILTAFLLILCHYSNSSFGQINKVDTFETICSEEYGDAIMDFIGSLEYNDPLSINNILVDLSLAAMWDLRNARDIAYNNQGSDVTVSLQGSDAELFPKKLLNQALNFYSEKIKSDDFADNLQMLICFYRKIESTYGIKGIEVLSDAPVFFYVDPKIYGNLIFDARILTNEISQYTLGKNNEILIQRISEILYSPYSGILHPRYRSSFLLESMSKLYTTKTQENGQVSNFIEWPPPKYSSLFRLPSRYIDIDTSLLLNEVSIKLERILMKKGYSTVSYHPISNGFAIATALEKIDRNGNPYLKKRWRLTEELDFRDFSFEEYWARLLGGSVGYYRFMIIAVTNEPIIPNKEEEELELPLAQRFAISGASKINTNVLNNKFSDGYQINIIFYIYKKKKGVKGRLLFNKIGAFENFRRSGLEEAFIMEKR